MQNNPSEILPDDAISRVKIYLLELQKKNCSILERLDEEATFDADHWTRPLGGGGITCIMQEGKVFAKVGVNFSHVSGGQLPPSASAHRPELSGAQFDALGLSIIIHPQNPYIPTAHANVRFFVAKKEGCQPIWWFGGGWDLTPYYGFKEDCIHWHQTALEACRPFGESLYPRFKALCDQYFYLAHRQEARGVGGLFFDDFNEIDFNHSFEFTQSIGNHFLKGYEPIVNRRKMLPYSSREKEFQRYRRGRYVEFNLLYDRGTLFGLQSGGRTESILMSLPPEVHWTYQWKPEKGSPEEKLYTDFLPAKDWLAET